MCCVECERKQEQNERGWVVVLCRPDEPRVQYCPDCLAEIIRSASGKDKQDD